MKKVWKVLGVVFICLVLFWSVINVIPPKKNVENNPFIVGEGQLPMIAAHRGGGDNNPENTMMAYRKAVNEIGIDIIESDLYLTQDGYLVCNHDSYVDRTCNVNGAVSYDQMRDIISDKNNRHYIEDMTLAELQQYNFGYYFRDENGNYPYQGQDVDFVGLGLQIATVEQLFEEFYQSNPDLLFIVEIKNGGERGKLACEKLNDVLQQYPNYLDNIVIGTFNDEIEEELKTNYPHLMRGAPTGTAAKFIITQMLRVNIFDNGDFACLQIPTSYDLGITLMLDKKNIIDRAHQRNVAVQYWTINDADEMRHLIELGCDAIMTDNPILLKQVLDEYR